MEILKDMLTKIIGHHIVPEESFLIEIENDTLKHDDFNNNSETTVKNKNSSQSILQESND